MNRLTIPLFLCSSVSFAIVPHIFKSNDPARAVDVNENFASLDSVIQTKVGLSELSPLSAKLSNTVSRDTLDQLLLKKANASEITGLTTGVFPYAISSIFGASFGQIYIPNTTSPYYSNLTNNALSFGVGGAQSFSSKETVNRISASFGTISFQISDSFNLAPHAVPSNFSNIMVVSSQGVNITGNIILSGSITTPTKSFPDFVFSSTYKLPALSEVDDYIKLNRHLPNVPSAEELSKTGMDLERMNEILLQKVEELSLYVIEQDKRIKALEKK